MRVMRVAAAIWVSWVRANEQVVDVMSRGCKQDGLTMVGANGWWERRVGGSCRLMVSNAGYMCRLGKPSAQLGIVHQPSAFSFCS